MNLEVQFKVDLVQKAVEARLRLHSPGTHVASSKLIRAEENVCIQTRALVSKFIDTCLWRGSIGPHGAEAVRNTLISARDCITNDERCRAAVEARLRQFDQFCTEGVGARSVQAF